MSKTKKWLLSLSIILAIFGSITLTALPIFPHTYKSPNYSNQNLSETLRPSFAVGVDSYAWLDESNITGILEWTLTISIPIPENIQNSITEIALYVMMKNGQYSLLSSKSYNYYESPYYVYYSSSWQNQSMPYNYTEILNEGLSLKANAYAVVYYTQNLPDGTYTTYTYFAGLNIFPQQLVCFSGFFALGSGVLLVVSLFLLGVWALIKFIVRRAMKDECDKRYN